MDSTQPRTDWILVPEPGFSVVDVETTGFNARGADRVVEIAVVNIGVDGRIRDEYTTLVDPGRDVGPTRIHGITATDLVGAPRFEEIAGDVLQRMRGTVVAAHNVAFDTMFLRAEFDRLGVVLPEFPRLCTLRLATLLCIPSATRQLADCCAAAGIPLVGAHSALCDAVATAHLLSWCLVRARERGLGAREMTSGGPIAGPEIWPRLQTRRRPLPRTKPATTAAADMPFLARVVATLPHDESMPGPDVEYCAALDRALEDRHVTEEEGNTLHDVAQRTRLTRGHVARLHLDYFTTLVRMAFADGVLTEAERADVEAVGRLLGLGPVEVGAQLASAAEVWSTTGTPAGSARRPPVTIDELRTAPVCFTGESRARLDGALLSREQGEALARGLGLCVEPRVTKRLGFLVAADPNTRSTKARTARAYGTRVVGEREFWHALGLVPDAEGPGEYDLVCTRGAPEP